MHGFKDLQGVNFAIAKHRENCIVLYPHIATIAKLKIKEQHYKCCNDTESIKAL